MGIILSRYRKKKNAEDLLEEIEKEIENIECDKENVVQREKYIVWRLIIYSGLIYIMSAVLFYLYFFPASLRDQIFYMIPLFIFPIIIMFVKKCISWIYTRKILKSRNKLADLVKKKKTILDDVMNTETYKVAKQILDKYGGQIENTNKLTSTLSSKVGGLASTPLTATPNIRARLNVRSCKSVTSISSPSGAQSSTMAVSTPFTTAGSSGYGTRPIASSPRRLIRPILPDHRSYLDRVIDSILGDGPNNRYALICKNCATHNGMALKEEFEYIAYRCVYCGFPNPALKTHSRPQLSLAYTSTSSLSSSSSNANISTQSDTNKTIRDYNVEDNQEKSSVTITEVTDSTTNDVDEGDNVVGDNKTEIRESPLVQTEIINSEVIELINYDADDKNEIDIKKNL